MRPRVLTRTPPDIHIQDRSMDILGYAFSNRRLGAKLRALRPRPLALNQDGWNPNKAPRFRGILRNGRHLSDSKATEIYFSACRDKCIIKDALYLMPKGFIGIRLAPDSPSAFVRSGLIKKKEAVLGVVELFRFYSFMNNMLDFLLVVRFEIYLRPRSSFCCKSSPPTSTRYSKSS